MKEMYPDLETVENMHNSTTEKKKIYVKIATAIPVSES